MHEISFEYRGNEFVITNMPEGVKAVELKQEGRVRQLADMALHVEDLGFAMECLKRINDFPNDHFLRDGLWRNAITHYIKCFGQSESRSSLQFEQVYKREPETARICFDFFKSLRNKHVVHDENSYTRCYAGLVLNDGQKPYKIERIICAPVHSETLAQANYGNLHLLIEKAIESVSAKFDSLCEQLTKELEKKSYADLASLPQINIQPAHADDVHKTRER